MNVLVAEDEKEMQKIVSMYLRSEGWNVDTADDGEKALELLEKKQYDLLILDWMMPKKNGLQVLAFVEQLHLPVKVIMLTAKDRPEDEISGLSRGADDYVKKPFEPKILLLRIKKMFQMEQEIRCCGITLNQESMIVKKDGREISLTRREYELLKALFLNRGLVMTRAKLLDLVWGMDYDGDERTLDTHIRRLRGKLGQGLIRTHVGLGYGLEDGNEPIS